MQLKYTNFPIHTPLTHSLQHLVLSPVDKAFWFLLFSRGVRASLLSPLLETSRLTGTQSLLEKPKN